jgi:hypothetical protein
MRHLQLTYNSKFAQVIIKMYRSQGNKKFINQQTVKGSGRLTVNVDDDPKYKGRYLVKFYDLFNNFLMHIEVEPVDSI